MAQEKQIIQTEKAPKAIGPYSQAVKVGSLIFTAGQIGLDPQSGELIASDIESQTRQALMNLKQILEAAGASLSDVIKTTVFLQDMTEFPRMNSVYAEFFPQNPPARSTVAVAALPKGARVEIEAVAHLP